MLLLTLLYVGIGLLFIGISKPLVDRRIRRNYWYGFRTPKTLSEDRIWYAANAYMGRLMMLAGAVNALAAILWLPLCWIFRMGEGGYVAGCTVVMLATLSAVVAASFRFLSRL